MQFKARYSLHDVIGLCVQVSSGDVYWMMIYIGFESL